MLDNHTFLKATAEEFANEPLIPAPLISGNDLMALGWEAGPTLGRLLREIQTRQLECTLQTSEEALAWVKVEGESFLSSQAD